MRLANSPIATLQSLLDNPPTQEVTIQFDQPGAYDANKLKFVNKICRELGAIVSVRFYGHYHSKFDCSVVSDLVDCRSLIVDSHEPISNIEAIASLPQLDKFGISVFETRYDEVLDYPNIRSVGSLLIGTNRRTDWDLAPLQEFASLRSLSVAGQHKNLSIIGALQNVQTLRLNSIPRKASLDFISTMSGLRKLKFLLGGREHLGDLAHPGITDLEVIWVKGLTHLDCTRFPAIEALKIENQAKIVDLDFSENPNLKRIHIDNCKVLKHVDLTVLRKLESLFIGRTGIELEDIMGQSMPATLSAMDLYGYGRKRDAEIDERLRSRGYRPVYRRVLN
jgi:hypothetical protein